MFVCAVYAKFAVKVFECSGSIWKHSSRATRAIKSGWYKREIVSEASSPVGLDVFVPPGECECHLVVKVCHSAVSPCPDSWSRLIT